MKNIKQKVKHFWYEYKDYIVGATIATASAAGLMWTGCKLYDIGMTHGVGIGAATIVSAIDLKYPDKEVGKLAMDVIGSQAELHKKLGGV